LRARQDSEALAFPARADVGQVVLAVNEAPRRVFDEVHPDGPTPGVPTSALPAYSWLLAPACPRWDAMLPASL
jgi:hypothetical protein